MEKPSQYAKRVFGHYFIVSILIAVVAFVVFLVWSGTQEMQSNQERALAEARALNNEISASWSYIDSIQPKLNSLGGDPIKKGVFCVVASKDIAERFSEQSDYSIRYVRESPRNTDDEPDSFENEALVEFAADSEKTEYYGYSGTGDNREFRYVSALRIEEGCLSCHGDPAGEEDQTGYSKEGMQIGQVAGAVSIVMPMDEAIADSNASMLRAVIFFLILMVAMGALLAFVLRRVVEKPVVNEHERLLHEQEEQSHFLAMVSHELKTPLSSVMAFTDVLKDDYADESGVVTLAEEIDSNSKVLAGLVNNLLDAAKLESGVIQLRKEDVDVYDLAELIRSMMKPLAEKNGVVFTVIFSNNVPIIKSDGEALRKIATNLVSNALRYTSRGGCVTLAFAFLEGSLVISVQDDGSGIEDELIPHLFERFSTSGNAGDSFSGGVGLGLYIVKSYIDMMDGTIDVSSKLGEGSCFTARLTVEIIDDSFED